VQIEFNDNEQLENNVDYNTAAIYIELIQGEGGIKVATNQFIEKIKKLREKFGFALVADEVQSGIGRTGQAFAYNHYNIQPDLVLVAKAIGGGLPLGALITSKKYDNIFQTGDHGTTFGGNPVACAAGLAVMNEVFNNGLVNEVARLGNYFKSELNSLQKKYPDKIADVRGSGFMLGVELFNSCSELVDKLREKGILVNCTSVNVLRILPPLIATKENIDHFINIFNDILIGNV
jgi:acetylornithine/succinyldiaminopimelate/putrescine aminotransferase